MIRPARETDAAQATPLLCAAWGHLAYALTGAETINEAQEMVAGLFTRSGNRLSHENTLIAEQDGRVAGVLVCYEGSHAATLDGPLMAGLIERTGDPTASVIVEAAPDEFYLDTLSVHPEFQRRGLGAELLRAFERRAGNLGYVRMGLLVEGGNEAAQRLYAKAGYTKDGTRRLAGESYDHLEKHR